MKVDRFSTWMCNSVTGKTGLAKWSRLCPILKTVSAAYLAAVDPDSYVCVFVGMEGGAASINSVIMMGA